MVNDQRVPRSIEKGIQDMTIGEIQKLDRDYARLIKGGKK